MADSFPRVRAQTHRFTAGAPHSFRISDDGAWIFFLQSTGERDNFQLLLRIPSTGGVEPDVVADPRTWEASHADLPAAELARRERLREGGGGITSFDISADGGRATFALGGEVYVVDCSFGTTERVVESDSAHDPRLSPAGTHCAWLAGGDLWITDLSSMSSRKLLAQHHDSHSWGVANFLAAEEFDRTRGYWWSPTGDGLLVEGVDDTIVSVWYLSDPANPASAPRPMRYPAAGSANPELELVHVDLAGRTRTVWRSTADWPYLTHVSWDRYGPALLRIFNREQTHARTAQWTAGELELIAQDTDPNWVSDLPGTPRWHASGELVTTWRQAENETIKIGERVVPLGDRGQVTGVLAVVNSGLLLEVAPEPPNRAVILVSDSGDQHLQSPLTGYATATATADVLVQTSTDLTSLQWTREIARISAGSLPTPTHRFSDSSLTPPVRLNIKHLILGPDDLQTVVVWPYDHQPGAAKLPIILNPYGGPHAQRVLAVGRSFAYAQWLADHGFAVVISDGHGTPGRGPAWERSIKWDLATHAVADQASVVAELALQYPADVDDTRVGISGWSFGGYLAALAVLRYPETFHCAFAGAPVTDWRWYDTAYTERYLGMPDNQPHAYDQSSLIPLAPGLVRPLCLIHGFADDNVYAKHSVELSAALTAAGRPHTFIPLPNVSHMTPQVEIAENLANLELTFFTEHLTQ